ncbi:MULTISPECIES: glucose-1-phosphate adenylyltransferase [unclassified Colwellia]|mgnify:FL=1|uniref:glucose-1-phosphate adenylyltransferase n=1 Tax=unclassified Colwellia TaxID=196834 RepID=UPI000D3743FE|nr:MULTISPECIES: glucose-1-phosphate adenylyltransferase [unclassified Colwellia]AWB57280.1 glucose-1-phosphate adenylyltransferase [Colwellia sp. Arc7-D]MBA6416706.1 glucose-1-phosphate adenylyltransferase [Colwellia sp. 6M3]
MPNYVERRISSLTKETYALILAGGRGSRLYELTDRRAKPATFFGGKFRIIDFPLSNCINSGIRRVGIATQYKSHSLIRHVNRGWGHFKKELGESIEILPASQQTGDGWYLGTANAVFQNIDIIRHELPKYVMILSGDHVYRMDYGPLLAQHVASEADMTVCCIETSVEEAAGQFGVMTVDEDSRVCRFDEKPANPSEVPGKPGVTLASMGNYVFNTEFLFEQLEKDAAQEGSSGDFGNDIIPRIIESHRVFAYPFKDPDSEKQPYWRDVGTLDSFWEANMELVAPEPQLNMYDENWPIWTYQEQTAPAKFVFDQDERRGIAIDSTVSGGVVVSGSTVKRTLLFSKVRVNSYCEIDESVILPGVVINRNCKVKKAIIDRGCEIPAGMEIGINHDDDRANGFRVTDKGVVLVTIGMLAKLKSENK